MVIRYLIVVGYVVCTLFALCAGAAAHHHYNCKKSFNCCMQPLIAGILMKFYKDVAAKKGEASSESEVDKGSEDGSDVQQTPTPTPEPTKKQIEKEKEEEQSEPQTAPKIRTVYTTDEPIQTEADIKDSKAIDDQEQNLKEKTAKRGKKKDGKKIKYEDIKELVASGKVESQPVATDKVKSETSKTSHQDDAKDKSATETDDDSDLELPDVMAFNLSNVAGQRRRAVHYVAVSEHSLENQDPEVADEEKNSDSNECPPNKVEPTDESADNKEEPGDSSQTTGEENSDDFTEIKIEIPQCNVENIEISDESVNDRNSSATKNKMSKPLREDSKLWVPRGKVHSAEADMKQAKMGKVNDKTSGIRRRRCAACGRQTDRTSSGWIQHKVNRITSPDPRQIRGMMREENNVNKTVGIRKRRCASCGLQFESDDTLKKGNKDLHKSDYYVIMRKYNGQTVKYNRGDFREKPKADSIIKQRCAACGYQEADSERRKDEKGKKVRQDVIDINIKVDHVQPKTNIRRTRCAACGQLEVEAWQMKDEQVSIKADKIDLEGQDKMQDNTRKDKTVKETKEKDKTDSIRKRNCSACVEHIELKEQSVRQEFLVMFLPMF